MSYTYRVVCQATTKHSPIGTKWYSSWYSSRSSAESARISHGHNGFMNIETRQVSSGGSIRSTEGSTALASAQAAQAKQQAAQAEYWARKTAEAQNAASSSASAFNSAISAATPQYRPTASSPSPQPPAGPQPPSTSSGSTAGGSTGSRSSAIPAGLARPATFSETQYRSMYPDVDKAIKSGQFSSAWQHYLLHGKSEGRKSNFSAAGSTGSTSSSNPTSPAVPYPYTVATKNGISHAQVNEFLSKVVTNFNKANGTNFQLNSEGHIRSGGSGAYMSIEQQKAFNSTIPVNAVDFKYGKAIDKAIAGDVTDLKNLDRFFTGAERPAEGYSKEYLLKEKEARGLGISVAELDKRNAASAPVASTGSPIVPQKSESETNKQEENEKAKGASAEEHRKDEEAHAKAAAAQAEADEKKQQALALATANKNSAKEERIRKINEMRKPWGGAASSSSGSDAMVAPPITPASQVPPPPFQ
jgi:hypothetical protein